MKRRYVILYWHLFSERDWVRYSCAEISARGYEVLVVQLAYALEGLALTDIERRSFKGFSEAKRPGGKTELLEIFDTLTKNDLILIAAPVNPRYLWLHLELGRRGLGYAILTAGRLPEEIPWRRFIGRNFRQAAGAFLRSIKHIAYRFKFHLLLVREMGLDYFRVPAPTVWGRAGSARPWFATDGLHLWRSKSVAVESFDVSWARRSEQAPIQSNHEPYAVFIDEALCDHPDYRFNSVPAPVSRETYFDGLRNLFDRLESELGLKTIVALHPKANYSPEELPVLFGSRPILLGQTPALVRHARLVLLHNSTSISYAVLYRKPIMFITSNDIDASWLRPELDLRSSWLNQPVINIDSITGPHQRDLRLPEVIECTYQGYENELLRSRDATSVPPMVAVADCFEKINTLP